MHVLEAIFAQDELDIEVQPAKAQLAKGVACGHRLVGDGAETGCEGAERGPGHAGRDQVGVLREGEVRFVLDQVVVRAEVSEGGVEDPVAALGAQGGRLRRQVDVPELIREEVRWEGFDVDAALQPDEVEFGLFADHDRAAFNLLAVQRRDVCAGAQGHHPEVGGHGLHVRRVELLFEERC